MDERVSGQDLRMRDAVERVVGTLPLVLDRTVPDMTHGRAVRSQFPHAVLRGIDTSAAEAAPGVIAVITGADLQADEGIDPWFGVRRADQPALAIGKVRHVGEPVAVVVAETAREAAEAALLVAVDYDPLDHVVDEVEAMGPDAPTIHDAWPDNECGRWQLRRGDLTAGWEAADRVYEATYRTPPGSHVPMEPHVCLARWEDGALHVWSAAQAPHAVHRALATMFGLDHDDVRVEVLNLGGAYGAKGQVKIEPMVACAARFAGRPVRMELDRDEVFYTIGRHAATVTMRTGVTPDGAIVAQEVEAVYNAGAYAVTSPGASGQALIRAPGPYRLPNIHVTSTARYTNTVPTGPFRGAMTAQVCFAYESQMDDIAADLGIDPVELRRRNLLRDGDEHATGETMHDVHFVDLVDDAAHAIGWDRPTGPTTATHVVRGKGLGVMMKSTVTPSRSEVRLELHADDTLRLLSSSVEMGQGANATLVQVAADALGLSPDVIDVPFPDTSITPFDTTTSSSRTTFSMGAAIADAAANLRAELARLADADVTVVRDGQVEGRSYGRVLKEAGRDRLVVEGVFQSEGGLRAMDPSDVHGKATVHWHQGATAAEVEVDLETGRVTVVACHGACWAGRVINPFRVRQQNQGCLVFGLGPALFEEVRYSDGQFTNPNLSDYMIPSILDVPPLTTSALEAAGDDTEVHGVGEMALPGVAPAIANAIFHATGVRIRTLPFTAERVLRALRDAGVTPEVDR